MHAANQQSSLVRPAWIQLRLGLPHLVAYECASQEARTRLYTLGNRYYSPACSALPFQTTTDVKLSVLLAWRALAVHAALRRTVVAQRRRRLVQVDVNAEAAPDVISNPQALSAALQALVQVGVLLARSRDGPRDC